MDGHHTGQAFSVRGEIRCELNGGSGPLSYEENLFPYVGGMGTDVTYPGVLYTASEVEGNGMQADGSVAHCLSEIKRYEAEGSLYASVSAVSGVVGRSGVGEPG